MINEVANELGVDPESAVMTDVLTAVQSIAKEEDLISAEVKAARKISAWWRHTKKRRNGEVPAHHKFPPPRDPSGAGVLNSIKSIMAFSPLWKPSTTAEAAAAFKPTPPPARPALGGAQGRRGGAGASDEVAVLLHSLQEQVDAMAAQQKEMAAALADSHLHEERIDAKLEEIMKRLPRN